LNPDLRKAGSAAKSTLRLATFKPTGAEVRGAHHARRLLCAVARPATGFSYRHGGAHCAQTGGGCGTRGNAGQAFLCLRLRAQGTGQENTTGNDRSQTLGQSPADYSLHAQSS
jgi:hypothetical protein